MTILVIVTIWVILTILEIEEPLKFDFLFIFEKSFSDLNFSSICCRFMLKIRKIPF